MAVRGITNSADGGPSPRRRTTKKRTSWQNFGNSIRRAVARTAQPVYRAPQPVYRPAPQPVYRAPVQQYRAPARSGGNYNGGGGGGGGAISRAAAPAPAPKAPPAPKVPTIEEWLAGDTTYKSTQDSLSKALADYLAEKNRQTGLYNTEYDTNVANLTTSRQAATTDLENDYASRGMLTSGTYADALSQLSGDYDERQNTLTRGKSNFLADLETALADFKAEQELATTNARQNALNRRIAQFGLG